MLPKCCAEHQKPGTFQRFSPTFQNLFLKRDFFDSLNGPRLVPALLAGIPAAGGTRLAHETDKTQSHEKSQFGGENPAVRVHAVLDAAIGT